MSVQAVCLFLSVWLSDWLGHVAGSEVPRIRGIPVRKTPLYSPERDFECLDGSMLIPFSRVNDDYCDCADGSDEPGTAACRNGSFYCQNLGYKDRYIPSTWVNDGVCDCCDASDEYSSGKQCPSNCEEMGREARMKQLRAIELAKQGNRMRLEMIARGKQLKSEYQARLAKLRTDYEEAEFIKQEREMLKKQAEEKENIALERYKPAEPEQQATEGEEEEEELQQSEVEDYFKLLDSDSNGFVTVAELQTRATFDKDRDGAVSEEEAMYFLNNKKEVNMEEFVNSAWPNVKPFLMLEQGMFKPADHDDEPEAPETPETVEAPKTAETPETADAQETPDAQETQETSPEYDEREEEELAEEEQAAEEMEAEERKIMYDRRTQALIDAANSAREKFQEAEKAVNEIISEIRRLEENLERDTGPNEEFASLDGSCYEYSDAEYIYTLCMFGKATQKSKSGGSDITLGYWNEWIGPEYYRYTKMKYDRGMTCWNGPARSTIVTLTCGRENKLVSVAEPNRCEYAMLFSTPALCNPNMKDNEVHDEL